MTNEGLTVEDVNKLQEEMNPIGDIKEDGKVDGDKVSDDAKASADEATKLAEAKAAEEAKAKAEEDAKKAGDDTKKVDDEKSADEKVDIIKELREQNKLLNDSLKKISGEYQTLVKRMVDKGVITADEVKEDEEVEKKRNADFKDRQDKLNEIVAIMEVNPAYADVRQVCIQRNLDDIIDAFSRYYVKENGGDLQEVASKMENEIWQEPNPYKKIYELVKTYHPKYKVAAKEDKKTDSKETVDKKADDKKAIDANPSAATIGAGGSGAGSSGWTAAKIDALPEDELQTVPKDIYEKYLLGQLQ